MNYYEHHLGDWAAATGHLSWDEDMAYSRLLRAYYHAEKPIPEGQQYRLAKASTPAQRKAVDAVLAEFFELREGHFRQKRADAEIARYQDKQRKAKASANTRWSHTKRNANASPDAMRTHSEGNALQTPDTRQIHSVPDGTGSAAAPPPSLPDSSDTIFGLGIPLLTSAGVVERNARSMLGLMRKTHGDAAVIDALGRCATERPLQPVPWLQAALKASPPGLRVVRKTDALMAGNLAAAQAFLTQETAT